MNLAAGIGKLLLAIMLSGLCACRPAYHIYWGDVHGHTALSDGEGTPDAYFAHARDQAQLDFVILTDHDFGSGSPWRLGIDAWESIQSAAARATQPGHFVAIPGYEWTSQTRYWTGAGEGSEGLFGGPVRAFNHKNVYFPHPVRDIFRAKDAAFCTPDLLAETVAPLGGLIHNNHPDTDAADQWDYTPAHGSIIANTEIGPDTVWDQGKWYEPGTERMVLAFLESGGRTGFVSGSDTHDGTPSSRTAVLATSLTTEGVFDALRHRRTYAITHARIKLDFRIDGHLMGEHFETSRAPLLCVRVRGTAPIEDLEVVCDGLVLAEVHPGDDEATLRFTDDSTAEPGSTSFYYVRVTQSDLDQHGNRSRAWSSPIWVTRR